VVGFAGIVASICWASSARSSYIHLIPTFVGSLVLILVAKWIMAQLAKKRG
jgi:hypothetical protein